MFRSSPSNFWVLLGISFASFLGLLDLTVVNTALPTIQQEFRGSVLELQWVMNSVSLSLTTGMAILAKLADNYGRRRFLYLGLLLFSISSVGIALSPQLSIFIGFRFLQGIAIALLYMTPLAIIANVFCVKDQGKATGFLVGVSSFGLALGPAIGGILVSTIGWRWIFGINPFLSLICWLCCVKALKESKTTEPAAMDWRGFGLLLVSIPAFIVAMTESQQQGWLSWSVLSLLGVAVTGLLCLFHVEKNQISPMIQFSLLKNPLFRLSLIANLTLAAFYATDFFMIPLFLHFIKNYSGSEIGLTLLPATLLVAILSPLAGRCSDRYGSKNLLLIGLFLLLSSAVIQTSFNAYTPVALLFIGYGLLGIGWACILSPAIAAAMISVPAERSGVAAGMMGTAHNLGGTIGLALGTLIFTYGTKLRALSALPQQQSTDANDWLNDFVTNTGQGIELLMQHTPLHLEAATQLFTQAFLSGYIYTMGFLALLVGAIFSMTAILIKKRRIL